MTELEKDLRHYLSVALTPLFDIVKVAQKDRDNLFDAIVKGDLVLIDQHTKSEVRQVLDRIKEPNINDAFPTKPYDGTNTYTDMLQVVDYYKKAIAAERKLYE